MAYTKEADGAHEPFLNKIAEEHDEDHNLLDRANKESLPTQSTVKCPAGRCRQPGSIPTRHVLLHMILVALYTFLSAVTIYALRHGPYPSGGVQTYSPPAWLPEISLKPVATVFSDISSRFIGPAPNNTIDVAWATLLQPSNLRAADDDLTLSGVRSSIKSSSKDEFAPDNIVQLNVFHELQCLRLLRQSIYRSVYYAQSSEEDLQELNARSDQCIETLRQSVMCRPDLTLEGLKWTGTDPHPVVDTRVKVRECVHWDVMINSLEGRLVCEEEMEHLTNPHRPT